MLDQDSRAHERPETMVESEGFRPTIQTGLYRHYKGKMYRVLGVARHSETGEWFVVYQKQYEDYGFAIRPYDMFRESVMYNGRSMLRFVLTSADPPKPTDAGPDHYAGIFTRLP